MSRKLTVCHISTFPPTRCGIAEYAEDLIQSLNGVVSIRVRLSHDGSFDPAFEKTIGMRKKASYDEAVAYINESAGIDLVSIQHEFGIFGGRGGAFVLELAKGIRKPIVTTLHTVPRRMDRRARRIVEELASRSARVVVLTEASAKTLMRQLAVPASRVKVIRQGVPEVGFRRPESCDFRKAMDVSIVFVSAGLLRPSKGYHIALEALARYKEIDPHFKYVILGTLPSQFAEAAYQIQLERAIARLGLEANVMKVDSYLSRNEMVDWIMGADIGLVTYTEEDQNASAILPLFLACGRVVISTAFECARSIHKDVPGLFLAEMNNPGSVFRLMAKLARDKDLLPKLMVANYRNTRGWLWAHSAEQYKRVFEECVRTPTTESLPQP